MTSGHHAINDLLAALLNSQIEPDNSPIIDNMRLYEAFTTGPGLNNEEQRILCLSPTSRARYLQIKRKINAEIRSRWRAQGLALSLIAKAAAAQNTLLDFQAADGSFSVTLYRQDDADMPWMILLRLSPRVRDTLHSTTMIRLVDSGGLEWVRGRPDARGEISFGWYDLQNPAEQRLREYALTLDLV